jgi:CrcB protein
VIDVLLVALGGAVGGPSRFLLDTWVQRRVRSSMPVGTITINLSGALVLGALSGLLADGRLGADVGLLAGTGFCGAFTTFSTMTFESIRLVEEAAWRALAGYLGIMLVGGLAAAGFGRWLVTVIR